MCNELTELKPERYNSDDKNENIKKVMTRKTNTAKRYRFLSNLKPIVYLVPTRSSSASA